MSEGHPSLWVDLQNIYVRKSYLMLLHSCYTPYLVGNNGWVNSLCMVTRSALNLTQDHGHGHMILLPSSSVITVSAQ